MSGDDERKPTGRTARYAAGLRDELRSKGIGEEDSQTLAESLAASILPILRPSRVQQVRKTASFLLAIFIVLYLAVQLVVTYFAPLYALLWLPLSIASTPQLRRFYRLMIWIVHYVQRKGQSEEESRMEKFLNILADAFNPDLMGQRPRRQSGSRLGQLMTFCYAAYYLPTILIYSPQKGGKIRRWISSVARFAASYWDEMMLLLSFYYSFRGRCWVGFAFAGVVNLMQLYSIGSQFKRAEYGKWRGYVGMIAYPDFYELRTVLKKGLLIVLSYGAIFYGLSQLDPDSFTAPLTPLDSIYFSVVTAATIGYGDIFPKCPVAKLVVIGEILTSFCFVVIVIQTVLMVWQRRNMPDSVDGTDTAGTGVESQPPVPAPIRADPTTGHGDGGSPTSPGIGRADQRSQ